MQFNGYLLSRFCLLVLILNCLVCCKSSVATASASEIATLQEMVDQKTFEIISDVAYPRATMAMINIQRAGLLGIGNSADRISLIGNSNYLRINGDSVDIKLPYYGERQMGSVYSPNDIGISIDGKLEYYRASWNAKKQVYNVNFKARGGTERYDIAIDVFPNKTCRMTVSSSHRHPIGYSGTISLPKTSE